MEGKPMRVKDLGKSLRSIRFRQSLASVVFWQHESLWKLAVSHATSETYERICWVATNVSFSPL
jgi:hypothetical protein